MRVCAAIACAAMLAVVAPVAVPETKAPSREELEARADEVFGAAVGPATLAGASVLVGKGDEILLAKGYGFADIENDVAATEDTIYRLGSLSKQFTAVAILQLAEKGTITLDESIRTYLPDYPEVGGPITVRHLLNHTSGLVSYTTQSEYWKHLNDDLPKERVLDWFASRELAFPPGHKYSYSNSGYFVLGLILERVTGESFGDYVKQHILDPLDLKSTYLDDGVVKIPNKAKGYERDAGKLVPCRPLNTRLAFSVGSMASNLIDLFTFHRALRNGKLVSPASYEAMTTPAWLDDGSFDKYGMAFHVEKWGKTRVLRHGGLIFGFKTCNYYYPDEDLTIIILMNTEEAEYRPLQAALARTFIPDLDPKEEF